MKTLTKPNMIITALVLLASSTAMAQTLPQKIQQCSTIDNDIARLQCFDKLTQHVEPVRVPAKLVVNTPAAKTAPTQPAKRTDIFGFESQQIHATPDKILVTVTNITKSIRGQSTFTLGNGQQWKQKNNDSYKLKKDKQVYIKKGALGSFFLGQEGRNKKIRVKRIN